VAPLSPIDTRGLAYAGIPTAFLFGRDRVLISSHDVVGIHAHRSIRLTSEHQIFLASPEQVELASGRSVRVTSQQLVDVQSKQIQLVSLQDTTERVEELPEQVGIGLLADEEICIKSQTGRVSTEAAKDVIIEGHQRVIIRGTRSVDASGGSASLTGGTVTVGGDTVVVAASGTLTLQAATVNIEAGVINLNAGTINNMGLATFVGPITPGTTSIP
jgi:uncharacterized protein (DUF2345 family)